MANRDFDIFICHASEDKERFVLPLLTELRQRRLRCWIDYLEIQFGDDFRRRMDEGLARSRFGVVILSPHFFKYWPLAELSALFNQEATFDEKRILPVRCDVDRATMTQRLPLLAGRADLSWDLGVAILADRIRDTVRSNPTATTGGRSPAYNLPIRRARKLVGRDPDLKELMDRLQPGKAVGIAASIEGLAGVGKTELALHLVDRLAERGLFPGGIFWFDAENPDLTHTWGGIVADALAVGHGEITERAAAALRLVSAGPPALIVLDNVEQWTKTSEPRPLPMGAHVGLLATTRRRFLAGPSFFHHSLEFLPEEAARELLFAVAGRDLGAACETDRLLEHLGGHSLALELAGAYLREFSDATPQFYLDRLLVGEDLGEAVEDLVRYEGTVRRALDEQSSRLDESARHALRVAACFAPEDASLALLEACGAPRESRQPLLRLHLMTARDNRWRMHRLVREWAKRSGSAEERSRARRGFVEGCADYAGSIELATGYLVYRDDGAHLELAMGQAESVLGPKDPRLSRMYDRLGTALHSFGSLPRARELLEQALASDLGNLGGDHPSVATSRSNLATVLRALGELPRARELLEQALASDLGNLGGDHPTVATRRSNLATVLQDLGELPRARELLEQALASDLGNLGEDHPSVATSRSNLALVLKDLGELPRARELLEQALASDLRNLGGDHPTVATLRSNLALVLQALGELPRARELLEQALASDLRNLGEDHPSVATYRFNLATIMEDSGDYDPARRMFAQALAAEERSLGPDHPSTCHTRARLAGCLARLGRSREARIQAERALKAISTQPAGSFFRVQVERAAGKVLDLGRQS